MQSFSLSEKNGVFEPVFPQNLEKSFNSSRVVWLDFQGPNEADTDLIKKFVSLHPITIDGILRPNKRAKIYEFEDYLFLVVHTATYESGKITPAELDLVVGKNFIFSFHAGKIKNIEEVQEEALKNPELFRKGPSHVLYYVLESTIDSLFNAAESVTEDVELIEDEILGRSHKKILSKLFALKRNVVVLRKIVLPQREVLNYLFHHENSFIESTRLIYFRDLFDNLVRIAEFIDTSREIISDAFDAYLSVVSNNLNEVMKVLTIFATIVLPMSLVASYYGMNVEFLEYGVFGRGGTQFFALFLIFLIGITLLFWFRKRKWI